MSPRNKRFVLLAVLFSLLAATVSPCLAQTAPAPPSSGRSGHQHSWHSTLTDFRATGLGAPPARNNYTGSTNVRQHFNSSATAGTRATNTGAAFHHNYAGALNQNNYTVHLVQHNYAGVQQVHQHIFQPQNTGRTAAASATAMADSGRHGTVHGFFFNLLTGKNTGSSAWIAHHDALNSSIRNSISTARHTTTPDWNHQSYTHVWVNCSAGATHFLPSLNLDLSATSATLTAGHLLNGRTVTIDVGGTPLTVNSHTALTPAEYLAVLQVAGRTSQSLILDSKGSAVGGSAVLGSRLSSELASLVIPSGVTLIDLTASGMLNIAGNFVDNGSLFISSFNHALNTITLSAGNINVQAQGILSNILPSDSPSFLSNLSTSLNLSLQATNNIINAGSITSSLNLSLTAGNTITNAPSGTGNTPTPVIQSAQNVNLTTGSGNLTNSGRIVATAGNINISTAANSDLVVNATGGQFSALKGNINSRNCAYAGTNNTTLVGGDYLSQELNLSGGAGQINANLGNVTGQVNTSAQVAHINAQTPVLVLGRQNISGDPTYANSGDIFINDILSIPAGADLAIVAGGNILSTSPRAAIVDNGGNVILLAGAKCISGCTGGTGPYPPNPPVGDITVSFAGGSGGNIDFAGLTAGSTASTAATVVDTSSILASGAGGKVTMVALADSSGALGGHVYLNTTAGTGAINTSGSGTANGGSVTIYAGSSGAQAITTNTITTAGGSSGGASGDVTIQTTQAVTSDSLPLSINAAGTITSGNTIQSGTLPQPTGSSGLSGISTGAIDTHAAGASGTAAGNVTVSAYGDITVNGSISAVNTGAGSGGSTVILSSTGSVQTGAISTSNGGSITILAGNNITTGAESVLAVGGLTTTTDTNGFISLTAGTSATASGGNIVVQDSAGVLGSYATWHTLGITDAAINSPVGLDLIAQFTLAGNPDPTNAANSALNSGSALPVEVVEPVDTVLYKIVPTGSPPSAYTPFWMSKAAIDQLVANPTQMFNWQALPPSSYSGSYSVYSIKATAPATAFVSSTAPAIVTNTGSYELGGAQQIVIPVRSLWTSPVLVSTYTNTQALPSNALVSAGNIGVIARGNINVNSSTTNPSTVFGKNVLFCAGCLPTVTTIGSTYTVSVSANQPSLTGGKISLFAGTGTSGTISGWGGGVSLIALYGTGTPPVGSGTVSLSGSLNTYGSFATYPINPSLPSGLGSAGNILVLSGASNLSGGTSITLGAVYADGANILTPSNISLATTTPTGGATITTAGGTLTNSFAVGTTVQPASISTAGITSSGGNITLLAGSNITTNSSDINANQTSGTASGGAVTLSAQAGSISTQNLSSLGYNNAAGGSISLTGGTTTLVAGTIDTHASSVTGTSAGNITISSGTDITVSGSLNALNTGAGSGGSTLILSNTGSVQTGAISTSNGGSITILAGNNITTGAESVLAVAGLTTTTDTNGFISLTAGTSATASGGNIVVQDSAGVLGSYATWHTLGITDAAINSPVGLDLIAQFTLAGNPNPTNAANSALNSGSALPDEVVEPVGTVLYKIVPTGSPPSAYTPFWMSKAAINQLVANPTQMFNWQALPPNSYSGSYSVYSITATAPATAFVSSTAPAIVTNTGSYELGGAQQIVIPVRSLWTSPVLVSTYTNTQTLPSNALVSAGNIGVIARGNITVNSSTTNPSTVFGKNVLFCAGCLPTVTTIGSTYTVSVSANQPSLTGGKISLFAGTGTSGTISGWGGGVSLIALYGTGTPPVGSGTVSLSGSINTYGSFASYPINPALPSGLGSAGNILVLSGASNLSGGTSITLGAVYADGANILTPSNISLATTTPTGGATITTAGGTLTNSFAVGTTVQPASISTAGITSSGGNIALLAGSNITTNSSAINANQTSGTASGGAVNLSALDGFIFTQNLTSLGYNNAVGGSVSLAGKVAANNLYVTAGNLIKLAANSQILLTGGNLVFHDLNTVGDTIELGANVYIQAFNAYFIEGATQLPVQGAQPANVVVNTLNSGAVYFGADSITALAPDNTLTANHGIISFQALPGSAIQLDGNVNINVNTPLSPSPTLIQTSSNSWQILSYFLTLLSEFQAANNNQQILNMQIGTRIATDYTPVGIEQNWQLPLQGGVSLNNQFLANEALFLAGSFDASELSALANQGIAFGQSSRGNFLDLLKGQVFFAPVNDIRVQTREGIVYIPKGAVAWIMETGNDAAIYDLHDNLHTGPVKVVAGKKELTLAPGTQILLTRNKTAGFDTLNPGTMMGYRNIKATDLDEGVKAFVCDFSIADSLTNVPVIRQLLKSKDAHQQKLAWQIIKNATILGDLTGVNYSGSPATR